MASHKTQNFESLIQAFLAEHDNPTKEDWKYLIESHRECLSQIVDAAISHRANANAPEITDAAFFDKAIFDRTISKIVSQAETTPSALLEEASRKVDSVKGPLVKNVAIEIGIGAYPQLLNGILVGRTRAPQSLYRRLAQYFQVPIAALSEVFRREFSQAQAPAFKATREVPTVRTEPCSWEEAVRDAALSDEETKRLLELAD